MRCILLSFLFLLFVSPAKSEKTLEGLIKASCLQESAPDSCIYISQKILTNISDSNWYEKAYAYWNISQASLYKHKYHTALFYATKASDICTNDTSLLYQNILATMGWLYFDIGNYQQAVPYHEKAMKTAQLRKDSYSEVLYINALGLCALSSMLYPKALDYFRKASIMYESNNVNRKDLLSTIQTNIGIIYIKYEDWIKAEDFLLQSIENSSGKISALLETYSALSEVYLQAREFELCSKYLAKADSLSHHTNYSFSLMEYSKVRAEYEQTMGNFRLAYQHQKRYIQLLSKVGNIETQDVMNYLLEVQNEKIKQDKLILSQVSQLNSNKRTLFIITIIIATLIIALLYYIFKNRAEKILLKQKLLTNELKKKELQEKELNDKLLHKDELIESLALTISKRNEYVKALANNVHKHGSDKMKVAWKAFEQTLNLHQEFNLLSEEMTNDFTSKLRSKYLELTSKDILMITDIRNNLSSKDMAEKYNIEVKSIEMSRYRLRKKLKIDKNISLRDFICSLHKLID